MCTPPPPALLDDLIPEFLIRLPPDDPACLARASLACKPWRSILTDAGFLRRFREFHRTPPMLGLLRNITEERSDGGPCMIARFVPTSSFRLAALDRRGHCIAAHHGRVLLQTGPSPDLVVWDPVTDQQWAVPPGPWPAPSFRFNVMVLCAAPGCDHLDCHGGPFAVAFVGGSQAFRTFAYLYSSETGEWSEPSEFGGALYMDKQPGVLVEDAVYFAGAPHHSPWIFKYDMGRGELSVIDPPLMHRFQSGTVLTATEDGKLGFAGVHGQRLWLWSREADGWTQRKVIKIETEQDPRREAYKWGVTRVICFAAGAGVIFVMTEAGVVFSVELESGRPRRTSLPSSFAYGGAPVLTPYESFYTPDRATTRISS